MAKQTVTTVVDDIDGVTPEAETITFALDGRNYEIDLSSTNNQALRAALAVYIDHARPLGLTTGFKATPVTVLPASDAGAVRAWAQSQGIEVSARGRVSAELRAQYYAAKNQA